MNIGISALTRFHMFDLASEMEARGLLGNLYTGYPKSRLPESLRKQSVCRPLPLMGIAAARRCSAFPALQGDLFRASTCAFDAAAARALKPHDVFIALSGQSIRSFRRAKELGARIVCERGSSHILFQDRILREEHELQGLPYRPINPRVVEQELEEYEFCDQINVPSTFVTDTFDIQRVPLKKVFKNPYGVSLNAFRPKPKRDSVFRILFVGNISLRKGVHYLIGAVKKLGISSAEVSLIGAAETNMLPLLSGLPPQFRRIGPVPQLRLSEYYSQGSVLVLPSIEEGLATVQAQAMACGIPVIATTNTGAADLFEDGSEGYIVPIRSPEAIADRLQRLMDDPALLRHMSENALKRVQSIGGWHEYGERAAKQCQLLLAS